MTVDDSIKEAVSSQLGAALQMLENAVSMCPAEHWDTEARFWYMAYHCIFWTDYYLTAAPAKFVPPAPYTLSEFDPTGILPERTYTKTELLDYVQYCRQKASGLISTLTGETIQQRWINDYKNYSLLELLFYNVRHIQHHAAQLNLLLRQQINDAPAWVSSKATG